MGYLCGCAANRFHNPHLIKRPQAKVNNTVKKPIAPRPQITSSAVDAPTGFQQHSLDYYKSTADDDAAILEAHREARREQNRRKKDEKKFRRMFGDWRPEQPYKLRYPTKIDAYKASGAYRDKIDEFRDYLRAARVTSNSRSRSRDSPSETRPSSQSESESPAVASNPMFAPPPFVEPTSSSPKPNPMFAPPASFDEHVQTSAPEPSVAVTEPGESAFQQALRLAQQVAAAIPTPPPPPPPPPPPAPTVQEETQESTPPPPPPPPAYNPTISAPPVRYNPTISAAPVHYAKPQTDAKDSREDVDERPAKKQRTKEPPKPSKAALMMAKMGYVKGQGLGKNNDGVITHLEVKARKDAGPRQVRDEFDGDGKTVKSQQVFDVIGGKRSQEEKDHGPFGEPSRVIVTWGCVDGTDFSADADRDDGGIRQEMGDAFNTKASRFARDIYSLLTYSSLALWNVFMSTWLLHRCPSMSHFGTHCAL